MMAPCLPGLSEREQQLNWWAERGARAINRGDLDKWEYCGRAMLMHCTPADCRAVAAELAKLMHTTDRYLGVDTGGAHDRRQAV